MRFADDFSASHRQLVGDGYRISLLTSAGADALPDCTLPRHSALVVGHEEHGFSFDPDAYPNLDRVRIPQYGPIESLNVSVAASIAMYEYARRHGADV